MPGVGSPRAEPFSRLAGGGGSGLDRPAAAFRVASRLAPAAIILFFLPVPRLAMAAGTAVVASGQPSLDVFEVVQLAVILGVLGAAFLSAIWLIRERGRTSAENLELRARVADLNGALQRNEALLNVGSQRVVVWASETKKPDLLGSFHDVAGVPDDRGAFLAFGRWLVPRSAAQLEKMIAGLREHGTAFDLIAETQAATLLEIQGRRPGSFAIVRFASLSDAHRAHAQLKLEHQSLAGEHELLIGLASTLSMPFWIRACDQHLKWVNKAYAGAVDAADAAMALREEREFLGTQAREAIAAHHLSSQAYSQTLSAVVGGDRKRFEVSEFASQAGSAGLAIDRSEAEMVRAEYEQAVRSHSDTLDQLTTAVAIFDAQQKLRFFNQAFHKLWGFDAVFLGSAPDHALLLDRLRSEGKLAEQPEWRRWKESVLAAYRSVESQDHWWHLPDGRTIRVIANPQPNGGVTWVFENLTERIDLESRYNTAIRVQGETLDNLAEGVMVVGPDGRVRLSNPAFSRLWNLPEGYVGPKTHISEIRSACDLLVQDSPWGDFVSAVTGFDERRDRRGQVELINGVTLRYAIIHLPNGQVMMTFVDVTDTTNVERALKEKNEALQKADHLKNEFVQHVNYELRSPLTNIIGFTELLAQEDTGPLNARQRDYIDHIGSSSSVLLTIVNDILDLATVDAGIMELEIEDVAVRQTVESAADLITERLREHSLKLAIDVAAAPASFRADGNRVRQILFNLLSNAANYAPEGSVITMSCRLEDDNVAFAVHDDGPGMPPEILDTVFKRFQPRANGGRRRGAGLGLSIVKGFVELHHGSVEIESGEKEGTTVICKFPLTPEALRTAAE